MSKRDGGPVYPQDRAQPETVHYSGLSVRDYFAAAALTGLLGNVHGSNVPAEACDYAQAMVDEREKRLFQDQETDNALRFARACADANAQDDAGSIG